jgi:hypothetical protein
MSLGKERKWFATDARDAAVDLRLTFSVVLAGWIRIWADNVTRAFESRRPQLRVVRRSALCLRRWKPTQTST